MGNGSGKSAACRAKKSKPARTTVYEDAHESPHGFNSSEDDDEDYVYGEAL